MDNPVQAQVATNPVAMETIVALAKRRGFVFPSSEIYGGFSSTWDYGPLGVELKRNVKAAWWRAMVQERDDVVGLDSAILMAPQVWQASGHLTNFSDPLVDCKQCKMRFRADHVEGTRCPNCGGELTAPRNFNLMFKTFVGPVEEDAAVAYLRPETAQGIFVNFLNVQGSMRRKLPFGIAQQGKSFRNEITPGNFIFRTREFEQMEMEFFVLPGEDIQWYAHWREERFNWYTRLGVDPTRLRLRDHEQAELGHYSKATADIEYLFPMGWGELEGVAHRGDYDLTQHQQASGKDLRYFDDETKTHVLPYVIEPAVGADRATLVFLLDAYREERVEATGDTRVVLRLHPELAPIKVAIMPLSKKEPLTALAQEIHRTMRRQYMSQYDQTGGAIGKRYRRQDEIGTPLCITVDFTSLEDHAVTIRERDSMAQIRVPIADLLPALRDKLGF
ncbi:MAG: glycine--tRNA ligase [Chloroflexota bacterium]|nr:glycine--tRNA ligase [Chloroflexota bacterium]